jgi:hypothetical protein
MKYIGGELPKSIMDHQYMKFRILISFLNKNKIFVDHIKLKMHFILLVAG